MDNSNTSDVPVDVSFSNFSLTDSGNLKFETNISGDEESMYHIPAKDET